MTRTHERRLRVRLVAAAVVLLTLWSYAAYLTGQDAVDLLRVRTLADTLGQPIDRLIRSLQTERRVTAESLAGSARARTALAGAREVTDRAATDVRAFPAGRDLRLLSAGAVRDRAETLVRRLNGLGAVRSQVDSAYLDRAGATDGYDQLVDAAFDVYGPEWGAYESRLAVETRAVIALARARELLAREDTLVTAAVVSGRISDGERRRLVELVTTQRYARAEAAAGLPAGGRGAHQRLAASPGFAGLLAVEDTLLRADRADALRGISAADWRTAADAALGALHELVTTTARGSVERATPGAAVIVGRTGAVVGLGLIAVLAVLLGWAAAVRRLTDERARSGTDERRPEPPALVPPAPPTDNQPPAGQTGSGQALSGQTGGGPVEDSRAGELFLRVTRRNQVLLRDQLDLLDAMQRRERSAEEADELFQLDHLTTRIRRNVEKVITLAGATPARRWRRPVPLLDVTRGAVAEVPEYHRVLVAPHWPWSLAGPAVTDVVHLLAELIENALAHSSTDTTVRVVGEHRPHGCAIVVVDDGPGLDATALIEVNHLLANPPAQPPADATGLHTVALLAARCGARVTVRPSRRGGTTAIVDLPAELVTVTGGPAGAVPGPAYRPGRGGPDAPGAGRAGDAGGTGELPMRVRQSRAAGPEPGSTDTVELPVTRATRRHR
ncbi:nitrate- and nitrite sensing domain-containing protein [Micromonospora lupini]|uniref:histidine kinase n=1 Tax=Micromonospora lupini str. Lupac 08 TaxID=1150864 RepID=I0L2G6_9ACTN|nr:nitrate- and nitrite sensing domain-containing protein [Micromonospora lupini]CCH18013.1 Two-component histidine kinase [Micromonospora lupini str. Lupac 08]